MASAVPDNSGLADASVAQGELEALPELDAGTGARRLRRVGLLAGAVAAGVLVAGGIVALRGSGGSMCDGIVGPPGEIEAIIGKPVDFGLHRHNADSCSREVVAIGHRSHALITIDLEDRGYGPTYDANRFAGSRTFAVATGEATLYVATDAAPETADAQRRSAGRKRDTSAATPETRHMIVASIGDRTLRMSFDRVITTAQAMRYFTAVAERAR